MNRTLAKILIRIFPIRWIITDYSMFKNKYHLHRVRGDFRALWLAEKWIMEHSAGQANIYDHRPKWLDTKKPIEIT